LLGIDNSRIHEIFLHTFFVNVLAAGRTLLAGQGWLGCCRASRGGGPEALWPNGRDRDPLFGSALFG
jgi:hypothetical protein